MGEDDEMDFFPSVTAMAVDGMEEPVDDPMDESAGNGAEVDMDDDGDASGHADAIQNQNSNDRSELFAPSIKEIEAAKITKLAESNWKVPVSSGNKVKKLQALAVQIWNEEIIGNQFNLRDVMLLEFSQYLENLLWPLYSKSSPSEVVLSIVLLINEKCRQRLEGYWESLATTDPAKFSAFIRHTLKLTILTAKKHSLPKPDDGNVNVDLEIFRMLIVFLNNAFQSMEKPFLRKELLGLIGVSIWSCLSERRRELELSSSLELRKAWNRAERKFKSADAETKEKLAFDSTFLSELIKCYLTIVDNVSNPADHYQKILFCERFLELLIDLESQIPTRRYVHALIDDHFVVPLSNQSSLKKLVTSGSDKKSKNNGQKIIFPEMLERLEFYVYFQIDNISGQGLDSAEFLQAHYNKIQKFQRTLYARFRDDLEDLALVAPSKIDSKESLFKHFSTLKPDVIIALCSELGLRTGWDDKESFDHTFLCQVLSERLEKKKSFLDSISNLPIYPNEADLFDKTILPSFESFSNNHSVPIPKMGLQYLTILDYLMRSFILYREEAITSIRQDIEDSIQRLVPKYNYDAAPGEKTTQFYGWARMAVPIDLFEVYDVGDVHVLTNKPRHVRAKINYNIGNYTDAIRREWDNLRRHDVLFLVTISVSPEGNRNSRSGPQDSKKKYGITAIRGCEVWDVLGEDNQSIYDISRNSEEFDATKARLRGDRRTLRVLMDVDQYLLDSQDKSDTESIYRDFNVLVRRKAKENNFKAVLETIRDLMQSELVLPDWLLDLFLGYGDPRDASLLNSEEGALQFDLFDTFLDQDHIQESLSPLVPSESKNEEGHLVKLQFEPALAKKFIFSEELGPTDESEVQTLTYSRNYKGPLREMSASVQPLFPEGSRYEDVRRIALGCYEHIKEIFEELEEIRAFELLRNNHDRSNYLLVKEARIIALTCTYAALKRRELIALGFRYDTVVMEESAQILEVEAFIPFVLQSASPETGKSRLQRAVLIGDQHQLPPIVKNIAISRYGNMEQSLFSRLLRLGVPSITLDRQGRCRKDLCDLFRWRYKTLEDLADGRIHDSFAKSNPGFAFDYQFVNVEAFTGQGETEPVPYFYQNLGEAEYVVAVFQYMRLLGYPAHKISILTTYNGQKALIEDVLERRCRKNPLFGLPLRVSTVDKYQGQQNDYILLSLVRTKTIGHIRDVRRLVVALSRARLGMYIFGRRKLFQNCYELKPAFDVLFERPSDRLWLRGKEEWSAMPTRSVEDCGVILNQDESRPDPSSTAFCIENVEHMGKYVFNMAQEQVQWIRSQKSNSSAQPS
ncbi:hypothetical protein HDU96_000766 [Phlyctochytrium bullatum]|nr:hypothetical protein HDU96_000766 [Phlyctochytrium bullatum]